MATAGAGRPNQRNRTRKDLLQAANRLIRQGLKPSLEEVAAEAMVSRATAYRYFPSVEPLLLEAALDLAIPDGDALFREVASTDPLARVRRVDDALHEMIVANEQQLRTMLVHSLQRRQGDDGLPARQNRRVPLIEAALAPGRSQFSPAALRRLTQALALVMGPEAMVVCKDVLQLDDDDARTLRRWAIQALIDAARRKRPVSKQRT